MKRIMDKIVEILLFVYFGICIIALGCLSLNSLAQLLGWANVFWFKDLYFAWLALSLILLLIFGIFSELISRLIIKISQKFKPGRKN